MMIYLGGQLVAAAEARVDPWDRGLPLGDGLFETIAVRAGRVARLEAHLSRLRDGGDVIGLKVPLGDGALAEAFSEVIEANLEALEALDIVDVGDLLAVEPVASAHCYDGNPPAENPTIRLGQKV